MAASRAFTTIATGVLLISFLLAVTVSAGQEVSTGELTATAHHHHANKMKTTPTPLKLKQRSLPLSELIRRYDRQATPATDKYNPPLEFITSRHRVVKDVSKRKDFVGKPPPSIKVHKHTSHHVRSGRVEKVNLSGSKQKKSKVHLRKIKRNLEKLMGKYVQTTPNIKANSPPLEVTPSTRHVFKVKNNKKRVIDVLPSESKKGRKHVPRHADAGGVQNIKTINPLAYNKTITKKPKPHKKSLIVFKRAFVTVTKKHGHGKSKSTSFNERPLVKPILSPTSAKLSFAITQSKPKKLVIHKIKRRDVLSFSSNGNPSQFMNNQKDPSQRTNLQTDAPMMDSFPDYPSERKSFETAVRYVGGFISMKERFLKTNKSEEEHAKNLGNGMIKIDSNTNEEEKIVTGSIEKQCVGDVCINMTETYSDAQNEGDFDLDEPYNVRVKRGVGSLASPENLTVAWNDYNDLFKTNGEDEGNTIHHCISTHTFALGLICMSVILSVCFLLLWRLNDQPEKIYALTYIVACVVYVMLALLYLGSRSAYYIRNVPTQD